MLTIESLFPREQWEHTNVRAEAPLIDGDVRMFRLKGSELRVVAMPGVAPGTRTVIGYHILFRAGDNSMNMHVECSCDEGMLRATIKTAVCMSGTAAISHSKFIENFVRWYGEKCADGHTRRLADSHEARAGAAPPVSSGASELAAQQVPSEVPAGSASAEARSLDGQSSEESTSKRARVREDEVIECSVCMSAPADTLAVPCGHSVVCAACSRELAAQAGSANRTHCVVCRAIITHVAYPDNSVVAINYQRPDCK